MIFDIDFDLEKAKSYAINYRNSTDVECMIINNKGNCLFNTDLNNDVCDSKVFAPSKTWTWRCFPRSCFGREFL